MKEIAQALDVNHLLAGSIRKFGEHFRVSAQLIDAQTSHQLWTGRYDLEFGDAFTIQDQIAEQVAGAIVPELLRPDP